MFCWRHTNISFTNDLHAADDIFVKMQNLFASNHEFEYLDHTRLFLHIDSFVYGASSVWQKKTESFLYSVSLLFDVKKDENRLDPSICFYDSIIIINTLVFVLCPNTKQSSFYAWRFLMDSSTVAYRRRRWMTATTRMYDYRTFFSPILRYIFSRKNNKNTTG